MEQFKEKLLTGLNLEEDHTRDSCMGNKKETLETYTDAEETDVLITIIVTLCKMCIKTYLASSNIYMLTPKISMLSISALERVP